ncbi:MAG: response regulator transcription factor [Kouleothrix sp.]|nr:response regulator transcription factor [Kouleothrix sp.]
MATPPICSDECDAAFVAAEQAPEQSYILIADADSQALKLVAFLLHADGYRVAPVCDSATLLQTFYTTRPDLVLLDVTLPDMCGFDLCRQIRRRSSIPVIFLSARAQTEDKVRGLQSGGDDYVTKPFDPPDLLARVAALLRRSRPPYHSPRIKHGDLTLDTSEQQARFADGRMFELTPVETHLLYYLMARAGELLSFEAICRAIWAQDTPDTRARLSVHIYHLRKKIESDGMRACAIRTIRGVGYQLDIATEHHGGIA